MFDRTYGNESSVFSEYVNDSGYFLIFSENTSDTIMNMDIEGAEIVHTTVHDLPAAASIKGGNVILVWAEFNKYFYITIHGDLNTALKIARSVVRIR